jgi:predicted kinase
MKTFRAFVRESGLNPGLLKCVFLAGGPGSGKSTIATDVFGVAVHGEKVFGMLGMTVTSSDIVYERMLHEQGIKLHELADIEHSDPKLWTYLNTTVRGEAKREVDALRSQLMDLREGIIFDGTGVEYDEKVEQKTDAEHHGYDTYMIYVQTPLATSLARNEERERRLPEDVVVDIWTQCEANRPKYRTLYGAQYHEVEDSTTLFDDTRRLFMTLIREPVQNPKGRAWLDMMGIKG